jgi:hypothetical protein
MPFTEFFTFETMEILNPFAQVIVMRRYPPDYFVRGIKWK